VLPLALRQFRKLDLDVQLEATELFGEFTEGPFPFGVDAMEGYANLYKLRFYGDRYRIVYRVFERSRRIFVTGIGPRGFVYSGFRKPSR